MLASRPATAADVQKWYPDNTCSFRAWVCELDGEARGIIGLALTRPIACLFSAFDEELRPHLKSMTVWRLVKKTQALIEARGLPVFAIAEAGEPRAAGNLMRLGFEYLTTEDGDQVYEWRGR
jgi:hypothetical protein